MMKRIAINWGGMASFVAGLALPLSMVSCGPKAAATVRALTSPTPVVSPSPKAEATKAVKGAENALHSKKN